MLVVIRKTIRLTLIVGIVIIYDQYQQQQHCTTRQGQSSFIIGFIIGSPTHISQMLLSCTFTLHETDGTISV